jgi:hypothetical protein
LSSSPGPSQDFPAVHFILAARPLFSSWFDFCCQPLFSHRCFLSSDLSHPVSAISDVLSPPWAVGVDFVRVCCFSSSDPSHPVPAIPDVLFPPWAAGVDFVRVCFLRSRLPLSGAPNALDPAARRMRVSFVAPRLRLCRSSIRAARSWFRYHL